ncbi:hypothetical protein QQF64_021212 [Cirrhinus molitorella]|uniref:Uncharacterized protein n=1 Tax=Cirrhinus molitorella TaxID=172907 RepID=A0ABR3LBG4_9TELE
MTTAKEADGQMRAAAVALEPRRRWVLWSKKEVLWFLIGCHMFFRLHEDLHDLCRQSDLDMERFNTSTLVSYIRMSRT